jgi:hypothetical protein
VVWVDAQNKVTMTPEIQKVIQTLKDPTPGV